MRIRQPTVDWCGVPVIYEYCAVQENGYRRSWKVGFGEATVRVRSWLAGCWFTAVSHIAAVGWYRREVEGVS